VEKYLTPEQVAEIYGVKVITVWDWIRKKSSEPSNLGDCTTSHHRTLKNLRKPEKQRNKEAV